MWIYSTLYMYNQPALAQKYLPKDIFGNFYKSIGRNYLKAVKENGIFFANGDVDTYALWYLQESEGYRRDINVINTSLLSIPIYTNAIRKGLMHQPPVKMSFDSAVLLKV